MHSLVQQFDIDVLGLMYTITTSATPATWIAIFFASWLAPLFVGYIIVREFYFENSNQASIRALLHFALPALLSTVAVLIMKPIVHEARPFVDSDNIIPLVNVGNPFGSFPSAHSAFVGALLGVSIADRAREWKWFVLIALLVALGRVATGVHWPSDVISGLILGITIGFFSGKIFFRARDKKMAQ